MGTFEADGRTVPFREGETLLEALRAAGVAVPSLCHRPGFPHVSSCMACAVRDRATGRLLPSCSVRARAGMAVEAAPEDVARVRRDAVELLLGEHGGDCAAPCQRGCPAHLDVPAMVRRVAAGDLPGALAVALDRVPLPATLGRICSSPCEAACRRGKVDAPVAICALKRLAGDEGLRAVAASPLPAPLLPATGRRVAVAGAGPAGLSAAWHLRRLGHGVTLLDRNGEPGGMLLRGPGAERLPPHVVRAEAARILAAGIEFRGNVEVGGGDGLPGGRGVALEELRRRFDAVVVATGPRRPVPASLPGGAAGAAVDPASLATPLPGVFAGGDAVYAARHAGRSMGHGRRLASSVDRYLGGSGLPGDPSTFVSVLGPLREGEAEAWSREGDPSPRGEGEPATLDAARREARRCLHCDCRAKDSCALRDLAVSLGARQAHRRLRERRPWTVSHGPGGLRFEPTKCIRCGLCIEAARRAGDGEGLAWAGRGFDLSVAPARGGALAEALGEEGSRAVAAACPTGAFRLDGDGGAGGGEGEVAP